MEQLALDLGMPVVPPETVVSRCNEAAFGVAGNWPRWPHPVQLVRGPQGSGKSHLARAFAARSGATLVRGEDLLAGDAVALAAFPVAVDDADRADERALFHLLNAVRANATTLLLTATRRPVPALADLASRLNAVPEVVIGAPDDALLKRVMSDAFASRQLPPDPAVIAFLLARMERTLHHALEAVARIDHAGLAARRGPTRPLAARVLAGAGSPQREFVP